MVDSPIDRAAVQRALRAWVVAATELDADAVVWSNSDAPQRARPWAWLSMVGQPRATAPAERERYCQPMLERITVGAAAAGTYRFRIYEGTEVVDPDGTPVEYVAGGGDTLETIRDGLLADLGAWPVSAADVDDDASMLLAGTVDPMRLGFHVAIESGALTQETVHDLILDRWRKDMEITLRLQAETDSVVFDAHAGDIIDRAAAALDLAGVRDTLRAAGLVVRNAIPPVDLSAVIDSAHVSRVSQDFIFALTSVVEEERPWIRTTSPTQVNAY